MSSVSSRPTKVRAPKVEHKTQLQQRRQSVAVKTRSSTGVALWPHKLMTCSPHDHGVTLLSRYIQTSQCLSSLGYNWLH